MDSLITAWNWSAAHKAEIVEGLGALINLGNVFLPFPKAQPAATAFVRALSMLRALIDRLSITTHQSAAGTLKAPFTKSKFAPEATAPVAADGWPLADSKPLPVDPVPDAPTRRIRKPRKAKVKK